MEKPGNVVCECFGVTDLEIISAVKENHLESAEDGTCFLMAGGGCGNCRERIEEIVEEARTKA
jgi:NifU-like protein